jgi:hypothetical protein
VGRAGSGIPPQSLPAVSRTLLAAKRR